MNYASEIGSGGMISAPNFMTIDLDSQVILRLLQQIERLQCWYYWWEGFMKYAIEMA
jgi:hypothetical protein